MAVSTGKGIGGGVGPAGGEGVEAGTGSAAGFTVVGGVGLADADDDEAAARLEGDRGTVRVVRPRRGCMASALLLGALGTCCGAAIAWGVIGGGFDAAMQQMGSKISADLRLAAEQQGSIESHRGALEQLDEIRGRDELSWIALSILYNRWTDAHADDVVTEAELTRLMELVHDIDAGNGSVDPERYPDGR